VNRGDVYSIILPQNTGHEISGKRFAVILQSDAFLPRSVVIIAPTSQSARPIVLRPQIDIGGDVTRVVLDQVRAVSIDRLKDHVGSIENHEQWAIDDAIRALFGLN
jgi:mRNA interferase MazF